MIAGLLVPVFVSWSIARLHEDLGGARLSFKHAAVSFLIFLVAPVIYGSIFLKREVSWRGRSYKLGTDSRLSDGRALAADEGLAATHSHQGPTAQAA